MINKKLFLCCIALLTCLLLPAAESLQPEFSKDIMVKVFRGREDGLETGMRGLLLDSQDNPLVGFKLVAVDQSFAYGRIDSGVRFRQEDVVSARFEEPLLTNVRLSWEDSARFFEIGRGSVQGIHANSKGRLLDKDGETAGFFRILTVHENRSLAEITNLAPNVDYLDAVYCHFQDYADQIIGSTGFVNLSYKNLIMILIGLIFITLAIKKDYEPLLLVPIGFGILVGNIPLPLQIFDSISLYMIDPVTHKYVFNTTSNSVLGIIYFGVRSGLFPPLIFLGIGAMTDFSTLLSNPKSVLLGAAAQTGIFITFISAIMLGFSPAHAAAIGIIGGADGPTAIFLSSRLAPSLIGPIAIAAYSYMAMVPIIQPPIMKLLTSKKERLIRMKPGREVSKSTKILFPIIGFLVTTMVAPGAIPLLGMLFFGNLLKESGVTTRLAKTAASSLIDICTILLGLAVGASTTAQVFLNRESVMIFILGVISFGVATACGVLFAKFMNLFLKNKINPLIGAAGVSAVPDSARVVQMIGKEEDPNNFLLMHAMGPNVAGVIGSAIAAGVFLGIF